MTEGETKRDRVRRLLIGPLGFRFPKGHDADKARRFLDEIADELAYMADDRLRALRECLQTKGEGASRCFWPCRATSLGYAEAFQPRPIEELPAMASWLGSVEGPRARGAGTLLPTFLFIEQFKRPPVKGEADLRAVRVHGMGWAELSDRLRVAAVRRRRGVASDNERQMLDWAAAIEARALALVAKGEAKRGADHG